ncbi:MAG: AAA family ATPase, partial [Desulfobulbaceae bacterium]|nr:AAA family ATPase [Desulfobulbaceae bacterium]
MEKKFREDLYYRLNVVPIVLPPWRERREDIPLLFDHFLRESNKVNKRQVRILKPVMEFLVKYNWPGNVRELQNLIERLVIMADRDQVKMNDLPSYMLVEPEAEPAFVHTGKPAEDALPAAQPAEQSKSLWEIERKEIEAALRRHGWVQARAARELGLTQRQIGYRIKKYGLCPPDYCR